MSPAALLARLSDAQAEAVRDARAAVVEVAAPGRRGGRGAGTHLGDGRVVTCAHVVGGGREVRVRTASGAGGTARVAAVAPGDDLALLALPPEVAVHLPALRLGAAPALGASVVAVGHPGGSVGAASVGVVVGTDEAGRTLTDAHLRPGHSGGALVDAGGRLVGVLATLGPPDLGGAVRPEAVRALLDGLSAPPRSEQPGRDRAGPERTDAPEPSTF